MIGLKKRLLSRLLPDRRSFWRDAAKTILILFSCTAVNFLMVQTAGHTQNISELYLLSVLLISLSTSGYFWGLLGAAAGVVGTNYFFTYPYYTFNFSLQGYPGTFLCMSLVAGISSTLAAGIKEQRNLSQSREEKTQQLNRVAQQLLGAQTAEQIGELAARCLSDLLQLPACFYLSADGQAPIVYGAGNSVCQKLEDAAVRTVFSCNRPAGRGCDLYGGCAYRYFPISSGQRVLAAAGIQLQEEPDEESHEFLQLLLSQFAMALERQQLIQDIREDADWLLRMVENVLSVTRIGPQASGLRKVPEAVEEVIAQAVNRCRKRLPGLSLTVRVPEEFVMAPMDSTLIEQVLINLIENAYKYGRSAQPVEVTVCTAGENVRFVVQDHGPGIAPELLPVLFEGFLGRDGQSADSSRGLGIGLSICRSIITAHGGTIQAENRPGGGAQFVFTLPLEEEASDA